MASSKSDPFQSIFAFKPHRKRHNFIFLHGFGSEYSSFKHVFKLFEKKRWSFFAFNFPGHGNNQSNSVDELKLKHYVELVCDFIIQKRLKKVVLVGHSMGGAIAVLVNAVLRERIKALVLVAPMNQTSFVVSKKRILDTLFTRSPKNQQDFIEHTDDKKSIVNFFVGAFKKRVNFKTLYSDMVQNAKYGNDYLEAGYNAIKEKPTLVVLGSNDIVTPTKASVEYLAKHSETIIFKIIDGVGHSPHYYAPKLFFDYIGEFLDNIKRNKDK
ncbi:alpha/beta hydrolase [Mycoplasmoides pneumoniae]